MKKKFLKNLVYSVFVLLIIESCEKKNEDGDVDLPSKEISLEQKVRVLKNKNGENIEVIYFAEGDEVAVRIKKGLEEHKLSAKGSNERGEPIFTDSTYAWEMTENGIGGKLTKKGGVAESYK